MNTEAAILDKILKGLKAAKKLRRSWPVHIVARAAIVSDEAGELLRAALDYKYETTDTYEKEQWVKQMEVIAAECAASCILFIESLRKEHEEIKNLSNGNSKK